jgi:hypothetical protein
VALSADANTLVAGAPGRYDNTDRKGYVKVYRMTDDGGGARTQLGQTIYGNATGDRFGWCVDVTDKGNVIVVGSPVYWESNDRPGNVQVFSLDSDTGTWKQVGQDIAGEAIGDEFGYSVSISDDGETIAVGARKNDGKNGEDSGHVRIYRLADDGGSWVQIGKDINGDTSGDELGISVSLSANGSIVAIGAPHAGIDGVQEAGQVKVYRIDGGGSSWEQLGESIYGDNANDQFGWSVDISPDGNSLAVGTYVVDGPGYAKVFSLENGGGDNIGAADWKQAGPTITGEANGDRFGNSVSISSDAHTLAVGAPWANGKDGDYVGRVSIYRMEDSESVWKQIGEDIDGEAAGDYSGYSVSLSANVMTVAIGSYGNDDNGDDSGQVRVFGNYNYGITIQAENFSNMFGVMTENTCDVGGGRNVGDITTGDWMSYSAVTIPITGVYMVEYRVAGSGGSLQFEKAGGTPVYGWISIPVTGGYQTWTTISHTVNLNAGSQFFGIKATAGGWNLNWFRITKA